MNFSKGGKMVVILVGFYILFPVLAIWLCFRYEFFNKIGAVFICYLVGITVGNIGIIPGKFRGHNTKLLSRV